MQTPRRTAVSVAAKPEEPIPPVEAGSITISQGNLITVSLAVFALAAYVYQTAITNLKSGISEIKEDSARLDEHLTTLVSSLPKEYVRKADFLETINRLESQIGQVSTKMDSISSQIGGISQHYERKRWPR